MNALSVGKPKARPRSVLAVGCLLPASVSSCSQGSERELELLQKAAVGRQRGGWVQLRARWELC